MRRLYTFEAVKQLAEVGTILFINHAHKFEFGSWSVWQKRSYSVYSVTDTEIKMANNNHHTEHFKLDKKIFISGSIEVEIQELVY